MIQDDLTASFLSGKRLYGDDFSLDEIEKWFDDEKEGYADLGANKTEAYRYAYHALNRLHGFSFLGDKNFSHALGLGSAYGDEFRPIADKVRKLTILDPSDAFSDLTRIEGIRCAYQKPQVSGDLAFPADHFDLIVCLGVMHHIPNVSHVMSECYRCLTPNGLMLLREPIVSMGDWREPRSGLTKRERGIPYPILQDIVKVAGFSVRRERLCNFPLLSKLAGRLGLAVYNSAILTRLDSWLSRLSQFNLRYHATTNLQKLRPTSVYFVLSKN